MTTDDYVPTNTELFLAAPCTCGHDIEHHDDTPDTRNHRCLVTTCYCHKWINSYREQEVEQMNQTVTDKAHQVLSRLGKLATYNDNFTEVLSDYGKGLRHGHMNAYRLAQRIVRTVFGLTEDS